ncbi:indole-3-glycerol phosphate synthase TrpC [Bacillus aquiflavi]|uniref:Indole-3-glycerol phosphate synthase n=1 Tax=Bacillus aquiflavi TaxID=2672567 RepID=A0A6B3VYU8_9BACI|nr:indole-3-glycerol phosphate synthase TrpC [Bacillus aquiflavi]MBA4537153.1 indole-3-glycerol phosphate synthase TrpC [Bacillus aquiflavi]NEY82428.1 indole-3-glycerol phosphate synthase TrpC [Bacillus aquiflavi]UAC49777.1 indole-3-glycerol phosphate synthase TrpC [Bacillus aquiflavi]
MSTILDEILAEKAKEVKKMKEDGIERCDKPKKTLNLFLKKIAQTTELLIISEFKRASPSKGILNIHLDPVEQAVRYEKNGAAAISVLTDQPFFKGSFRDLELIRQNVSVPILCKDFIIDEIQIDAAKNAGADIILLIAAALDTKRIKELYHYATVNGLDVLMEVHDESELEKAFLTGAKIIGVNNRNLKTFKVDLSVTERLAPFIINAGAHLISESGIKTEEDINRVRRAGAKAVLIGEAFMTNENTAQLLQSFAEVKVK